MKVTIECDSSDEATSLMHADQAWCALSEIDTICRAQLKHGSPDNGAYTVERVRAIALEALRSIE